MDLQAYFDRIGFKGEARPDVETLRALHHAHLRAVPYENFDVQLGRPLTPDPAAAYDKLVNRRRGGWCYEMNGTLGLALAEIGFQVTRMAGGVWRAVRGDEVVGNHLILRVDLDEPWIADVGLGGGSLDPYPVRAGPMESDGYALRLEALDDRWWRFHNHEFGGATSFDFALEPAEPAQLASLCQWLQTTPESIFLQNLIAHRCNPGGDAQLVNRTLFRITPAGKTQRVLGSADELVSVLAADFGLDVPEAADLWPQLLARHDAALAAATP